MGKATFFSFLQCLSSHFDTEDHILVPIAKVYSYGKQKHLKYLANYLDPRVNDQVAKWKVVNGKYLNLEINSYIWEPLTWVSVHPCICGN